MNALEKVSKWGEKETEVWVSFAIAAFIAGIGVGLAALLIPKGQAVVPRGPETLDPATFFAVMAAFSASVQTLVDHLVKKRLPWLDKPAPKRLTDAERRDEGRRRGCLHLASFGIGALLAWSMSIDPLSYLGVTPPMGAPVAAGVLVGAGSSFYNELWGAIREYKEKTTP